MSPWTKVILLGLSKWPLKVAAVFVVPFTKDRVNHPVFGVHDATDLSWWNIAVRNGVHNMYTRPRPKFTSVGEIDETVEGIQVRWRTSEDGQYVSYRRVWGEPRPGKGKREIYVGWVMNEKYYMRLSFFQFRPGLWTYKFKVKEVTVHMWTLICLVGFIAAMLVVDSFR